MTDSKDFALLNDALDGRLDASAMEHLRRRIHDEADLAAAWEDLQRIRRALRSLPAPAVPEGFLKGIHDRAEAGGPSSSTASPASSSTSSGGGAPSIYRRWMYAAAASVGLGIGLSAYLASPGSPEAAHTETAQDRDEPWKSAGYAAREKLEDSVAETPDRGEPSVTAASAPTAPAPPAGGSAGAKARAPRPPVFLAPGGVGMSGLREPSDPPAPTLPRPAETGKAAPDAPPAGPSPTTAPPPPPAVQPAKAEDSRGASVPGLARGRGAHGARGEAEKKRDEPASETSLRLVAADFDEARARIALLVASIRRGDARLESDRSAGAFDDAKTSADRESVDAGEKAIDKAETSAAPGQRPEGAASRGALGSFVFALTPEEARRLTEALSGVSLAKSLESAAGASRSVSVRVLVVKR